jgi:hypothetical protein
MFQKSFIIGINSHFNFFDVRTNNIRASIGYKTILMVEPVELISLPGKNDIAEYFITGIFANRNVRFFYITIS